MKYCLCLDKNIETYHVKGFISIFDFPVRYRDAGW